MSPLSVDIHSALPAPLGLLMGPHSGTRGCRRPTDPIFYQHVGKHARTVVCVCVCACMYVCHHSISFLTPADVTVQLVTTVPLTSPLPPSAVA